MGMAADEWGHSTCNKNISYQENGIYEHLSLLEADDDKENSDPWLTSIDRR